MARPYDGKKKKKKRNMLKNMSFDEMSMVPRGANNGAHVSIFKIAPGEEDPVTKAIFSEVVRDMGLSEAAEAMMREMYKMISVLRISMQSIMSNPEIKEKKAAMRESLHQFMSTVSSIIDDTEVIKEIDAWLETNTKEDSEMSKEQLDAIQKTINSMADRLEKSEAINKLTTDERDFYLTIEKEENRTEFLKQGMMDRMKMMMDRMKGMTGSKRSAMMDRMKRMMNGANPEDKKKMMAMMGGMRKEFEDVRKDDETFTMEGHTISKSEVGDGVFAVLKVQQARIEKAEKSANDEREARLTKELEAEAERMFPNLPGTAVEKGLMLKNVRSLPEAQQEAQIKMLKAGNESMGDLFKETGAAGFAIEKSGEEKLDKIAKQFQDKDPNLTIEQAYAKAMKSPAGQKIYNEMRESSSLQ